MLGQAKVVYRLATHADKDNILRINPGVHDGLDCLPHYLTDYVNNPDIYCYVAEINGEIGGFVYVLVCDNGKGMIHSGSRVNRKYAGQDFMRGLRDHIPLLFDIPMNGHRGVHQDSDYFKKDLAKWPTVLGMPRLIQTLHQTVYCTQIAKLQQNTKSAAFNSFSIKYPRAHLKQLHKDEVSTELLLPRNKLTLFPKNCVLVGRHPFKPQKQNFEFVAATADVYVTEESQDVYSGVSFIEFAIVPRGLRVDMVYYGESKNLGSHILNFMELITVFKHSEDNVFMIIIFPESCDVGVLHHFVKAFGWNSGPWKTKKVHVTLVFKDDNSKL